MHAFLITGGTKEKRDERLKNTLEEMHVSSFDSVKLAHEEGKQTSVTDVRSFTKHLIIAPSYGKFLAGIIEDAQLLTTEAQNALLKTLEEPGPHALLILETTNAEVLLPTIVSRCQLISLGTAEQYASDDLFRCFETLEQLDQASVGQRIKLIDAIATDRDTAKAWVEKAIFASRESLLQSYSVIPAPSVIPAKAGIHHHGSPIGSGMITQLIRRLLLAQKQLAANVTPKLVLDAIFLPQGLP